MLICWFWFSKSRCGAMWLNSIPLTFHTIYHLPFSKVENFSIVILSSTITHMLFERHKFYWFNMIFPLKRKCQKHMVHVKHSRKWVLQLSGRSKQSAGKNELRLVGASGWALPHLPKQRKAPTTASHLSDKSKNSRQQLSNSGLSRVTYLLIGWCSTACCSKCHCQ